MTFLIQARRQRAPIVELAPAEDKIIEAIAFVIAEANRRGLTVTQYDIVKTLFLADRSHLNTYGRPITFDNYHALFHGPVPSMAYDLLKGSLHVLRHIRLSALPWMSRPAPEISTNAKVYFNAKQDFDEDVLSESDVECLQESLTTIKSLTFGQIRRLTHDDPAYIEAWNPDEAGNNLMSYALLFDSPDMEQAEQVKYLSEARELAASDSGGR